MSERVEKVTGLSAVDMQYFPRNRRQLSLEVMMRATQEHIREYGSIIRFFDRDPNRVIEVTGRGQTQRFEAFFAQAIDHELALGLMAQPEDPDNILELPTPRLESRLARKEAVTLFTEALKPAGVINPNIVSLDINVLDKNGYRGVISGTEAIDWCMSKISTLISMTKRDKNAPLIMNMDVEIGSHDYDQLINGLYDGTTSMRGAITNTWAYKQLARHGFINVLAIIELSVSTPEGLKQRGINVMLSKDRPTPAQLPVLMDASNGRNPIGILSNIDLSYPFASDA